MRVYIADNASPRRCKYGSGRGFDNDNTLYISVEGNCIGSSHGAGGWQWNRVLWRGKVGGGESFGNG